MFKYCIRMITQFLDDMRNQKLRCFLTMSGITWGTMSVILLLAFGESLRIKSLENMSGMGLNIIIMGGARTTLPYEGMPPGQGIALREEDALMLRDNIPAIGDLSPEIETWITLSRNNDRQNNNCVGVYPEYGTMRNLVAQHGGRFIDRFDMENRRRVIFIGTQINERFFGAGANPVGETIQLNGIPFTVIGVMQDKVQNSSYMNQDSYIVFIPFTTCRELLGATTVNRIIFRASDADDTPAIKDRIYELIAAKKKFDPADRDALWMWDTSESTRFLQYFFRGFEAFLLLGGVFTLLVGGIGVANIMYVSVRERRREIGIKSALGATPGLILAQFMLEAFIIMFVGGGIGVLGAWGVVSLAGSSAFAGLQGVMGIPEINAGIALIAVSILALIGFAAGWSPARTAANMDPVRALEF